MPGFREIFEAYGADYDETMKRFMGNEGMYLRLLDMLFEDDTLQKLGRSIEEGDLAGSFEAAHALKGVVGNMGLTPYYEAISAIVEPLRAREWRDDYLTRFTDIKEESQKAEALRDALRRAAE